MVPHDVVYGDAHCGAQRASLWSFEPPEKAKDIRKEVKQTSRGTMWAEHR